MPTCATSRSAKNIQTESLISCLIPDTYVVDIDVGFKSRTGKKYSARHHFQPLNQQTITLSSQDKHRSDFSQVLTSLVQSYLGRSDHNVIDLGDVLSASIETFWAPERFTQESVARKVIDFFEKHFLEAQIAFIRYNQLPEMWLGDYGRLFL
jgi:hypothetical protein